MKEFQGKVAVITGGTSGIGAATAELFLKRGARVVIAGRNEERGRTLIDRFHNVYGGGTIVFVPCDVSVEEQAQKFAHDAYQAFGHIDILFNNAGVMLPSKEIERMPVEDWEKTFRINVHGMFFVTRYIKPYLLRSKGCIINNGSIAGLQYYAAGRSYAYSASKAAVIQFSHQMAKNYGEEGIRVNCICPGIIDTPILGNRDRSVYAERVPLGYVAKPEAVAKVVCFLASEDAAYITGAILPVDGGVSL